MRRIFKNTILFTTIFLFMGFIVSTGAEKKYQSKPGNPLAQKIQTHQNQATSVNRNAFKREARVLANRVMSLNSGVKSNRRVAVSAQLKALQNLQDFNQQKVLVHWDEKLQTPIFIHGNRLNKTKSTGGTAAQKNADAYLAENAALLQIVNPAEEFELIDVQHDNYGMTHLRYQQVYKGLEVWARDVRVHLNRDGDVTTFNGRYLPTPVNLSVDNTVVDENAAKSIAFGRFGLTPDNNTVKKIIYIADDRMPIVTWLVQMQKGLLENRYYFIDARTGQIIKEYNHIMTDGAVPGSGVDLFNQTRSLGVFQIGSDFIMINAAKQMFDPSGSLPQDGKGVIYTLDAKHADSTLFFVTSANANSWSDKASVSAHANGALVYDFYLEKFGRNAIDGNGSTMNIIVNFKENFNNAFWNGQFMVFGNGNGSAFSDLAGALDVTAHEMSHGVIENTANLVYENQPGALNESFADVFGVLFEFSVEGGNGDWLLGEDITTPNIAGDALRNMENPAAANVAFNGQQPTKMSEFKILQNTDEEDHGGVHTNSGIPNRAFFLFATNPAVGTDKAGDVYYRVLTTYLTRNSQFIDCRLAVIQAAEDLHGAGSAEATAAAQAFDAVEIFDGSGTPPPPVLDPVAGEEFVAVINAATGQLVRVNPNSGQVVQLTSTALSGRPTVTDDGSVILYVDNTSNVHIVGSDGSDDQQVTTEGGFANIAISPNGQFFAVTSIFVEAAIYVFDLSDESGNSDRRIPLHTPTTAQGEKAGNILFPDRIDWASDSDILMYDALNITIDALGDTTGYWDINLLTTSTESIIRLFPPQPVGINIANPVFASNTDNIVAFDYVDEDGNVTVLGVNLDTFDEGVITTNFNSLGSPSFSNDDSRVYYHFINEDQGTAQVWFVDLNEDGITGNGNDQPFVDGAVFPVTFTIGQRPSGVETKSPAVPGDFTLYQNYPNPFNPETTIRYGLPESGQVVLTVYDITGREIVNLENANKSAGEYFVNWNGKDNKGLPVASGIYFYRVKLTNAKGQLTTQARKMTLLK